MSGVAGGTRIQKADVKSTFEHYIESVLKKIPGFKQAGLSGSVKAGSKPDFGDLDVIVQFEGTDKKEVKNDIIKVVTALPDSIIVPFKSEKYPGRKYYNSGEIISILFPIEGKPGEYIQIDNIIALTEEEHAFKTGFLDLPAEKQGLLLGLAKVILLEENPEEVFKRLGIKNLPQLGENEEYEFNLSSAKLTLRKVKLDNFREVAREDIWDTTNWGTIKLLFQNYNIDGSFEDLLQDIAAKLKNPRSRNRVAGIFKSMISVKSGEVGTPKGDNKERALAKVATDLAEALEDGSDVVSLYAGGFKPPHAGHFEDAKFLASKADKLVILIGPKVRDGIPIGPEQSKRIWEIYAKHIDKPAEAILSKVTPIKDTYDWIDANQDSVSKIITGTIAAERDRKFGYIFKNREKYPKVEVLDFPELKLTDVEGGELKLSASSIRDSLEVLKRGDWIPRELSPQEKEEVIKIALGDFYTGSEEGMEEEIGKVFDNFLEAITTKEEEPIEEGGLFGSAIAPRAAMRSEDKAALIDIYKDLERRFYGTDIGVVFTQDAIILKQKELMPEGVEDVPSYTKHIASLLEYMLDKKMKILPLPEIKTINDPTEGATFFSKTGNYNPEGKEITLYTAGRHPKDIVRSFAHEMIHHIQNLEGKITGAQGNNINEDDYLASLEEEAYSKGNMIFRGWEDTHSHKMQA